jgi:hypothetical protein
MRPICLAVSALAFAATPAAAQLEVPGHRHRNGESTGVEVRSAVQPGFLRIPGDGVVPRAAQFFNQGLRLYWAFNHPGAIESFREAERLDPRCAMCAWGTALALGPNVNAPMAESAVAPALDAVRRAQSAAAWGTPQEQALITALTSRYAEHGNRAALDSAYADAMKNVAERYPDDAEVLSLYAEALMNLSPWNYWHGDGSPRPATPVISTGLLTRWSRTRITRGVSPVHSRCGGARPRARGSLC